MTHSDSQEPIYSKVTSNTLYLLKGSLVTNGSLFVMNLILARTFAPLDISFIFIVMSVTGISMAIAEVGIPQTVTFKLSERISKGISDYKVEDISSVIISSFSSGMVIGILFVLGLFFLSDFIPFGQEREVIANALKISSLWIFFSNFLKISQGVFNGFQKMKYSFFLNTLVEPLKFLPVIVATFLGLNWRELIWGWTLTYFMSFMFCAALLFLFFNKERIDLNFGVPPCKKEILIQGLLLHSPILGSFLIPYILNLILARHEVGEVSYFALSLSLTSIYFVLFNAFSFAFLPAATQLMVQGDKERLSNIVIVGAQYIGLAGFVLLLIFYFLSDKILGVLYGAQYIKAEQVLKLLAIGAFFDSFKTIYDPLLMGTRRGVIMMIVEWIKLGVVLPFGSIAIEKCGLLGTGLTFFVSSLAATILKTIFIQRYLSIGLYKPMLGMGCLVGGLLLYHFTKIPFIIIVLIWATAVYYFKLCVWREVKYIWSLIRHTY